MARAADGSHRDGLSRLDQVLTFAGPKVTLADVAQVLGALPVELRFDLAEALAAHRVADVLACVERVVDAGTTCTSSPARPWSTCATCTCCGSRPPRPPWST